jgi:putative FmdB family regulatory protein
MAIYEYYCKICDYYFEVNKAISKLSEEQKCLRCSQLVERQFSTSLGAIIFKGSGFHKNDYRKSKNDEL